jgi:6-phosphogluconolactonase
MGLLISGYGGAAGQTAGIYETGAGHFLWESGVPRISFMCADAESGMLFCACEYDKYGKVALFTAQAESAAGDLPAGQASAADQVFSAVKGSAADQSLSAKQDSAAGTPAYRLADMLDIPGGALCHIAYSPRNQLLAGACYASGDLFAVSVDTERFGEMRNYIRQGNDMPEGTLTRAHCAVFNENESYLYSANIALDRIYIYKANINGLHEAGFLQLPIGVGPRHILPLGDKLYVMTEYSNELIIIQRISDEELAMTGRISTLPEGFDRKSFGSTLCFYPNPAPTNFCTGWIYAANRGADTVAVFTPSNDGGLRKTGDYPCAGKGPRHIAVVEMANGPVLAVANERSGYVSLCPICKTDGAVGDAVSQITFEGASYVSGFPLQNAFFADMSNPDKTDL